jgi:hypothetical protein
MTVPVKSVEFVAIAPPRALSAIRHGCGDAEAHEHPPVHRPEERGDPFGRHVGGERGNPCRNGIMFEAGFALQELSVYD